MGITRTSDETAAEGTSGGGAAAPVEGLAAPVPGGQIAEMLIGFADQIDTLSDPEVGQWVGGVENAPAVREWVNRVRTQAFTYGPQLAAFFWPDAPAS